MSLDTVLQAAITADATAQFDSALTLTLEFSCCDSLYHDLIDNIMTASHRAPVVSSERTVWHMGRTELVIRRGMTKPAKHDGYETRPMVAVDCLQDTIIFIYDTNKKQYCCVQPTREWFADMPTQWTLDRLERLMSRQPVRRDNGQPTELRVIDGALKETA